MQRIPAALDAVEPLIEAGDGAHERRILLAIEEHDVPLPGRELRHPVDRLPNRADLSAREPQRERSGRRADDGLVDRERHDRLEKGRIRRHPPAHDIADRADDDRFRLGALLAEVEGADDGRARGRRREPDDGGGEERARKDGGAEPHVRGRRPRHVASL